MTRFAFTALVVGILAGLLAAVVMDHRVGAIEARLDVLDGRVVCRLSPAPAARRLPAVDARRPAI